MSGFNLSAIKFNPFSYQDYVAPIETYQKAYNQAQATQDALDAAATEYQDTIMQNPDSDEAQAYQAYMQGLNDTADKFSKYGLEGVSTDDLYGMKKNYNHNIAPIVKAAKLYENLQGKAAEARQKGLYVSELPTLADLRKDYGASFRTASPDAFYKAGAAAAAAYGAQFSDAEIQNLSGDIGDWYQKVTQTKGMTGQKAMEMLANEHANNPLAHSLLQYLDAQGMGAGSRYSAKDIAEAANQYRSGAFVGATMQSQTGIQQRADNPKVQSELASERLQRQLAPYNTITSMANAGYILDPGSPMNNPEAWEWNYAGKPSSAAYPKLTKEQLENQAMDNEVMNMTGAVILDENGKAKKDKEGNTERYGFSPIKNVSTLGGDTDYQVVNTIKSNLDKYSYEDASQHRTVARRINEYPETDRETNSPVYFVPFYEYVNQNGPTATKAGRAYYELLSRAGISPDNGKNYYLAMQIRYPKKSGKKWDAGRVTNWKDLYDVKGADEEDTVYYLIKKRTAAERAAWEKEQNSKTSSK